MISVQKQISRIRTALVGEVWQHHCADKVGGCLAISESARKDALLALNVLEDCTRDLPPEKYQELLFAVGNKHRGETRHETALRYIIDSERTYNAMPSCEKQHRTATARRS